MVFAGLAGAVSRSLTAPVDRLKMLLQIQDTGTPLTIRQGIRQMASEGTQAHRPNSEHFLRAQSDGMSPDLNVGIKQRGTAPLDPSVDQKVAQTPRWATIALLWFILTAHSQFRAIAYD